MITVTHPTPHPKNAGTAVWFSRHEMTPEQKQELSCYDSIIDLRPLASVELNSNEDVERVRLVLANIVGTPCSIGGKVTAIYGVFPTPLLHLFCRMQNAWEPHLIVECTVPVFAAWNVSRTPEGASKPTFSHKEFLQIGVF